MIYLVSVLLTPTYPVFFSLKIDVPNSKAFEVECKNWRDSFEELNGKSIYKMECTPDGRFYGALIGDVWIRKTTEPVRSDSIGIRGRGNRLADGAALKSLESQCAASKRTVQKRFENSESLLSLSCGNFEGDRLEVVETGSRDAYQYSTTVEHVQSLMSFMEVRGTFTEREACLIWRDSFLEKYENSEVRVGDRTFQERPVLAVCNADGTSGLGVVLTLNRTQ
jgi:hypothetical protein